VSTGAIYPASVDGAALGSATAEWADLFLADGAKVWFGNDQDVRLEHVADTGLLLSDASGGGTTQLQFGDSGTYINQSSDGVLNIATDGSIKFLVEDEDLKLTKTGSNGITLGTNTGTTDISTALNLISTGTIASRIPVVPDSNGLNIATTQISGHFHLATGTGTWLLPAMAAADGTGYSFCIYSTTNDDVDLDVDASDKFRYNGALKTAGKKLTISDVGSFICAILSDYDSDIAHWTILGTKGTITAEAD
jgi:hypothetical protein